MSGAEGPGAVSCCVSSSVVQLCFGNSSPTLGVFKNLVYCLAAFIFWRQKMRAALFLWVTTSVFGQPGGNWDVQEYSSRFC